MKKMLIRTCSLVVTLVLSWLLLLPTDLFGSVKTEIDLSSNDDPASLAAALATAAEGDVVLLGAGKTYNAGGFAFDKSIEIKMKEGSTGDYPVIDCSTNFNIAEGSTVGTLKFTNILFKAAYASNYVFNIDKSGTIGEILFNACNLRLLRGVTRLKAGTGTLSKFSIVDCVLDSIGNYGVFNCDYATWTCTEVSMKNSTFWKVYRVVTSKSNVNMVNYENCTFSETPQTNDYMIRGSAAAIEFNTISITNCIWGVGFTGDPVKGFQGTVTTWNLSNNYTTNNFSFSGNAIEGFPNTVYQGTPAQLWVDPANGNFSFLDANFAGKSTAGDPRYAVASGPKKIAYITKAKVMTGAGSAQVDNDPILRMLKADANLEVTLDTLRDVSAAAVVDLTPFDAVVIQESFGGGDAIFKPGNALGLAKINKPVLFNKTYALKAGRALATGQAGTGAEKVGIFSIHVDAANQAKDLFKGMTFTGDSLVLFKSGADDNGGNTLVKALNYAKQVVVSDAATLFAVPNQVTAGDVPVIAFNDIPAGTVLGGETLAARMLAFGVNFGAICKDNGTNLTSEGLTLWRNAVYSLVGLDIPATLVPAFEAPKSTDAKLASIVLSAGTLVPAFNADTMSYAVSLPIGTTTVNVAATANDTKASMTGTGDVDLSSGSATVNIEVTAEDGTTKKTYVIAITVEQPSYDPSHVTVSTVAELKAALASTKYKPGDDIIIELKDCADSTGMYQLGKDPYAFPQTGTNLTIKAAEGSSPKMWGSFISSNGMKVKTITFDGLSWNGGDSTLTGFNLEAYQPFTLSANDSIMENFMVTNCTFLNLDYQRIFRANNPAKAVCRLLTFEKNYFDNMGWNRKAGTHGNTFIHLGNGATYECDNFIFKNNILKNFHGSQLFTLAKKGTTAAEPVYSVTIENNTFYKLGGQGTSMRNFLEYNQNLAGKNSVVNINNNLIYDRWSYEKFPQSKVALFTPAEGQSLVVNLNNNFFFPDTVCTNIGGTVNLYVDGTPTSVTRNDLTMSVLGITEVFISTDDLTIDKSSKLYTAGTNGTFIGAEQCYVTVSNGPVLTHSYTFEDGTAKDVVGSLDGTLNGTKIAIADGMCTVSGATAKTDGYISLDAAALALNTYKAITLEAYLKTTANANGNVYSMLAYFGNNTGGNKCFWIQPLRNGVTESRIETNNGTTTITAAYAQEFDDGNLHHLVAILTPDALKYYIDGTLAKETSTAGADYISTLDNQVANIFKGPDGWGDPNYNVSLAEFNIYNGILDSASIADRSLAFIQPSNSYLANLTISAGQLVPAFDPDVVEYAVSIPDGTSSITVDAVPAYSGATVTGTGAIGLTSGSKDATITVKSADGTNSHDYVIHFIKEDASCFVPLYSDLVNLVSDYGITDLSNFIGWGNKTINVNPQYVYCGITSGKINGVNGGSIDLNLTGKIKTNAIYRIKAMVYVPASGSCQIGVYGVQSADITWKSTKNDAWETLDIEFTTPDAFAKTEQGMFFNNYNLSSSSGYIDNWELYEIKSNDATLKELTLSAGIISPAFSSSVTAYEVNLPTGSTALTVTATANHAKATVTGAGAVNFDKTGKTVSIVVTAEDGTTKTYTLTITVGVSAAEFDIARVRLYPNPASGYLNVDGLTNGAVLKVISAAGQQLAVQTVSGTRARLDLNSFSKGMYMLRIEAEGKISATKFVKE